MALTTLDPTGALVVIDLQNAIKGYPLARPFDQIVEVNARLAAAFRARKWPVVWVNVGGMVTGRTDQKRAFNPPPGWMDLVPGINRQPSDFAVTKHQIGAFYDTGLERTLRRNGVTQVFVTGVATSVGVEMTVRSAYDEGFNVVAITDAMTDMTQEAHDYSVTRVFPRISETTTSEEVLRQLKG